MKTIHKSVDPLNVRVDTDLTCREWLRFNGYADVARLIDEVMAGLKFRGLRTRRNWWLILAGTAEGDPREVDGRPFPVLKAARRRQGFPPDVTGALERSPHELAPSIERQERWGKGFKRALR